MGNNEERMERKFSIYDLLWNVLEKWRALLICMIVFAVVLVAYGVVSNHSIEKENQLMQTQKPKLDEEEQEEKFSTADQEQVDIYWELYQQYIKQKDYNENAVLMKLDAEKLHRTTVKFYVDKQVMNEQKGRTETDENFVKTIKGVLRDVLESTELIAEVENIVGTEDMKYISECVDPDMACNKVTEDSVNTFAFAVVAPTKEQSEAIAQKAVEIMEKETAGLQGQFGEFQIFLMSSDYAMEEDQTIFTYQQGKYNNLWSAKNTLAGISANFTKAQVDYLSELSDGALELESKVQETESEIDSETDSETVTLKKTTSPVLYGIVGLFIGVLFVGFATAISYLNDKRMRFYSIKDESTGVRIIQTLIDENYMKSNSIDKFLFRMRYRNLRLFQAEEALAFAVADIKSTMKKKNLNKLYISLYDKSKQKKLAEKMKKSLEADGICVDFGNSILYDAQAMEQLAENEAIVFVEECNRTLLAEIEKEKMLCGEKEIQMLGMIVEVSGTR